MITNPAQYAPIATGKSHSCPFVSIRGLKIAGRLHGAGDALSAGMRIISIFIVLAIVYLIYGRNGDKQSPQSRIAAAQTEAAAVQPLETSPQPGEIRGSLRAPIDRTHATLDLVRKRNGE